MKKVYTKPAIYIETFELMEHISKCTANPDITTVLYRGEYDCPYIDDNLAIFHASVSGCDVNENSYGDDFDDFDDFLGSLGVERGGCYNSFSDGNFFAS